VLSRSMLTLDMDYGTSGIWEEISTFFPYQCCIYSTHKHTPENPRLRLIIPLLRGVGEEEYAAVSHMVAKDVGIDLFDDTTYEPERLMYCPLFSMEAIYRGAMCIWSANWFLDIPFDFLAAFMA